MEAKLLTSLGKLAGIAGIGFGVLLILFQGVLQKQFLPQVGLQSDQAFAVIFSLMIFTFGVAGLGLVSWLIGRSVSPRAPVPNIALFVIGGLMVVTLAAALFAGSRTAQSGSKISTSAECGGVAIGGNVSGSSIQSTIECPPKGR